MVSGIGGVTARRLAERLGGIEAVFGASDEELIAVPRITPEIVARLREVSLDDLDDEIANLSDGDIGLITWDDAEYPSNLRRVDDAPPVLFVRGDLIASDENAVAIVGTREPSPRSAEFARSLARSLAERGITIVSGLASGADTAAHEGALEASAGRTLGVLGSGVRFIHPRENAELAEAMIGRGALISEFHPNTPPSGPNLMARDRVISGLSKAVVVVEAGLKSGSLDTAAKARRQGRAVFAVPGSPGTDDLIASGAEPLDADAADPDEIIRRLSESHDEEADQLSLFE
jgi:DNA processing protein